MKILLDEQVPEPVIDPLEHLLRWHQVHHVQRIGWKGKKDLNLIPDLAARGYQVLVTADVNQLHDERECKLIKKYGFHHVRFQQVGRGVLATGSAISTIVAGLTAVVPELDEADGQRLVLLKSVKCGATQYEMCDPVADPPSYWPGRGDAAATPRRSAPRQRPPSTGDRSSAT